MLDFPYLLWEKAPVTVCLSKILRLPGARGVFLAPGLIVVCVAILSGFALAGWFWREFRFDKQWRERLTRLEAQGIPIHPSDLLPPAPPEVLNAAPILEEAAALHNSFAGTEIKNAFSISGTSWKEQSADPAWRTGMIEAWNTPEALRLANLVNEAARRPVSFVQRDWSNPFVMSLEPNTSLLKISRWLAMRAAVYAQEGRASDPANAIESMFRLADLCYAEPLLVSFLVGLSIEGPALDSFEIFLRSPSAQMLDASRYKEIESALVLREQRVFPSAVRALDGERIFFADFIFEQLRRGGKSLPALLRMVHGIADREQSASDIPWLSLSAWAYQYPLRFFMDADQLAMADFHEKTRARFSSPLDANGRFMDYPRGDLVGEIPAHAILTRLAAPALDGVFDLAKIQVVRFRLARIAVAASTFRRAEARWPESPEELLRFDPSALVSDRFTGLPVVWKITNGQLEIQSHAFDWPDDKLNKNRRQGLRWTS